MIMEQSKLLNALLFLTSLIGLLEWGGGNSQFLFQIEGEILSKIFNDPLSVLHPFTILPMAGQLLLLATLFQKRPSSKITYWAIGLIGLLFGLILFIGIITLNFKILLSTFPFLISAFVTIKFRRSQPE